VHSHPEVSAGYFGRIGAAPHDRGNDYRFGAGRARGRARARRKGYGITELEIRLGSECVVDRDSAQSSRRRLLREGRALQEK
jgi:hypothetical protein